jgi:hypothetical protein
VGPPGTLLLNKFKINSPPMVTNQALTTREKIFLRSIYIHSDFLFMERIPPTIHTIKIFQSPRI